MSGAKRQPGPRVFEVVVSFNALNKGERFSQQPGELEWALQHVRSGYLVDVTEEAPDAGEAGKR